MTSEQPPSDASPQGCPRRIRARLRIGPERYGPWLGAGLVLASTLVILALTLHPADGRHELGQVGLCLLCGEFGLANILRNILLFLPLGVGLGLLIPRPLMAWLPALILTAFIETVQLFIPGRNALLVDVAANAAGAAGGIALVRLFFRLLLQTHPLPIHHRLLQAAFVFLPFLILIGTAFAFQLRPPPPPQFTQLAPNLFHTTPYPGAVARGWVGDDSLAEWWDLDSDHLMAELFGGEGFRLEVTFDSAQTEGGEPGPESSEPAKAGTGSRPTPRHEGRANPRGALLSIRNGAGAETLYLGLEGGTGVEGDELVVRLPYQAAPLRLDRPFLRTGLPPELASPLFLGHRLVRPGHIDLPVRHDHTPAGLCLAANGNETCGIRPTLGRGWGLLLSPPSLRVGTRRFLDAVWLLGLGILPGLLLQSSQGRLGILLGLPLTATLAPSLLNSLAWTPVPQLLLLAAGAGAGVLLRSLAMQLSATFERSERPPAHVASTQHGGGKAPT